MAVRFLDGWKERCPVHGVTWEVGPFGRHEHGNCQRKPTLKPLIAQRLEAAAVKKGWDRKQVGEWIKVHCQDKTWSTASTDQLIDAMEALEADAAVIDVPSKPVITDEELI